MTVGFGAGLVAVFVASLVGSLHCVGMCGGFVAVVAGAQRPASGQCPSSQRRDWRPSLAYHATRGAAYLVLGVLAGLLGSGLDQGGSLAGIQRVAGPLMGLVLIALALVSLRSSITGRGSATAGSATAGTREPGLIQLGAKGEPNVIVRVRRRLTRAVAERGASAGAAAGLLTALLPCGWLWAYVLVAASTGSVVQGAAVMGVFWLGTVPALLGAGLLAGELGRRLGRHAPKVTAGVMLVLGLLSLSGKWTPVPMTGNREPAARPESSESSEPTSAERPAGDPVAETSEQPAAGGALALPDGAPCH